MNIKTRNACLSVLIAVAAGVVYTLTKDPDKAWQLATAIASAAVTLWMKSGRTPAPDLPAALPLAEELYRAYRAVKPISVGGAVIPKTLAETPEGVQAAWQGVAEHLIQRIAGRQLPPVPPLPRTPSPTITGAINLLLAGVLALSACAAPRIERVTTATDQADDLIVSFEAWSAQHQIDLVKQAPDRAAARAALATFRQRRDREVLPAIDAAHKCLDAVAASLPGSDRVARTCVDDLRAALLRFQGGPSDGGQG